jgi:hypothetical protein
MKKFNHPLITEHTERVDEIVELNSLIFDPDNLKLYGKDDDEYYKGLLTSINHNGLFNPPVIYDNNEVKSGHTRIRVCIELRHITIPIIRSRVKQPPRGYKNMMALMTENQTRATNLLRQYKQIKTTLKAYAKYKDMKIVGEFKEDLLRLTVCPAAQMSYHMYNQLEELEEYRPGLFKRVMDSNGSKLSPGKAYDLMMFDRKMAKNPLPQSRVLENMIMKYDINHAVNRVNNAMNQLKDIQALNNDGDYIQAFNNIQQNVLGGLVHELFTNAVADSINHRTDENSIAHVSKAQRIEDIMFPNYNASIEVKTCLIKDGNKIQFTTRRIKTGYHLLLAMTPDYDYVYCSYGWLDETVWKKAYSGPSKMIINELQKVKKMQNFAGELKLNTVSGKVNCMTTKLGDMI